MLFVRFGHVHYLDGGALQGNGYYRFGNVSTSELILIIHFWLVFAGYLPGVRRFEGERSQRTAAFEPIQSAVGENARIGNVGVVYNVFPVVDHELRRAHVHGHR